MRSVVLVDIATHLLVSVLAAAALWPYLGSLSLIIVLLASVRLIRAWVNADRMVAGKAGFGRPTLVQRRYLEYLGVAQEVFTHPSLLSVAGTLASSRRRSILLTSGAFNDLSEDDMRHLLARLRSRDRRAIFAWTFHLATGGAGLFSGVDRDDLSAQWGRRTLMVAAIGGGAAVTMAVLIAAPLSMRYGHPIDISPIVPVLWMPPAYLAARFVWRRGNALAIKPASAYWNGPINLEQATFNPMLQPLGGHPNLNLIRHGLLIADRRPEKPAGA